MPGELGGGRNTPGAQHGRLRRAARRRTERGPTGRGTGPTRWSALRRWTTATAVSALAGAIGAVAVDLATSAEHKAADATWQLLHGQNEVSTLTAATGPTTNLEVQQGMGCPPDSGWVFPMPLAQATATPGGGPRRNGHTWDSDPPAFGAVTADPVMLLLTATGQTNRAVTLTGLKFHVTRRRPALKGIVQNAIYPGCGAGGTYHFGQVDLSSAPPYWVPTAKLRSDDRTDAVKFPYTVTANDPETFLIEVDTGPCDCTWHAELDWVDGDRAGSTLIQDNGKDFETTASGGLTNLTWWVGQPTPSVSPGRSPYPAGR